MALYWRLAQVCATISLLLRSNLAQISNTTVSCSMGEAGFTSSSLDELIRYSDVILAGRVSRIERGEFWEHNATVSYFLALKSDALLIKKLAWFATVEGFDSIPRMYQFNIFFLMRHSSTMKLSLLCMSSDRFLFTLATIDYIKAEARNQTRIMKELGVLYPDPCDESPGLCGPGASCSALRSPVKGRSYRCVCLPGYSRTSTQQQCRAVSSNATNIYCSSCSYNARCSYNYISGSGSNFKNTEHLTCSCHHIQCHNVLQSPICGSDGHTYQGLCEMRLEACKKQVNIYKLHRGSCQQVHYVQESSDFYVLATPAPCMGLGQPLTTSLGLVSCLGHATSCPVRHFCHQVEGFYSACCPVLRPVTPTVVPAKATHPPTAFESHTLLAPTATSRGSGSGASGDGEHSDGESGSGDDDEESSNKYNK